MSTNWMKLERALARAEKRLRRRVEAHAWLIIFNRHKWHNSPRTHRTYSIQLIKTTDYPGWYDRTAVRLSYNEVYLLACDSETLVLRLRALKYHGSVEYIDPRYTKLPHVRDYNLNPDL